MALIDYKISKKRSTAVSAVDTGTVLEANNDSQIHFHRNWPQHCMPLYLLLSSSPSPERSCLLVCRSNKDPEVPLSPSTNRHNISQMVFHKIRKEDLEFVSFRVTFLIFEHAEPTVSSWITSTLAFAFRMKVWVKGLLPKSSKGSGKSWEIMVSCIRPK